MTAKVRGLLVGGALITLIALGGIALSLRKGDEVAPTPTTADENVSAQSPAAASPPAAPATPPAAMPADPNAPLASEAEPDLPPPESNDQYEKVIGPGNEITYKRRHDPKPLDAEETRTRRERAVTMIEDVIGRTEKDLADAEARGDQKAVHTARIRLERLRRVHTMRVNERDAAGSGSAAPTEQH